MMFCKLSFKNIKKSVKDYAIYFFTLILGVSIFYVFNAIESQTIMMNVTASTRSIVDLMTNILSGVSVFVSFILGFLMIYASRFLMKRRKKEFGIYMTLGMSKQKISFILFLETLIIGIISLIVGLTLGMILSQWMSLLVVNLFEADMTSFTFVFSLKACIKTIFYFSIIYLFVMLFNTLSISKCKLLDLLYGEKQSEKVYLKNSWLCFIIFLASFLILGFAYYMVTAGVDTMLVTADKILIPIAMGCIGTFGVIWSFSGLLLKGIQKWKKIYYKGLNCFTLRQISSKINTMVFSMSVICIMLFVTICVFSSALSIKNSMTYNLTTLAPMDIEFTKPRNLEENDVKNHYRYTKNMIPDSWISLRETLDTLNISLEDLKDRVEYHIYKQDQIHFYDTLGEYNEEAKKKYPLVNFEVKEEFIALTDYNKVAKAFHFPELELTNQEYMMIADFDSIVSLRNEGLKRNTPIKIEEHILYPKKEECINGFFHMSSNHINSGVIVVPDEMVKFLDLKEETLLANYKQEEKKNFEENLIAKIEEHSYLKKTALDISTKLNIYESSIGLGALVTFIGLYLGIIFLISSAAILALKELSESTDNKKRFTMLRNLGVEEKKINQALFWQIGIFFLFPLILAIIHSVFGIQFCNIILETFGEDELLPSIIMTSCFLIVIYGGYFLITYSCSKQMIKER